MSRDVLLTIAIPVHNGALYLRQTLDSILAQTVRDFAVVVSENASTDDTPAILAEYAARDARIQVFPTDSLIPQIANFNRALLLAQTPWVKPFAHDDLMRPHCVETLLETIRTYGSADVGLIGDGRGWLFANGVEFTDFPDPAAAPRVWAGHELLKRLIGKRGADPLPALINSTVRREAFATSSQFDPRFEHCDRFLWLELLTRWNYVFIPRSLCLTRIHAGQGHVRTINTLRSVQDSRIFWREFLSRHAAPLRLNWRERLLPRLSAISAAGTLLAIQIIKRRWRNMFAICAKLPLFWLPVLPMFVANAYRKQQPRLARLRDQVSVDLIFPDYTVT